MRISSGWLLVVGPVTALVLAACISAEATGTPAAAPAPSPGEPATLGRPDTRQPPKATSVAITLTTPDIGATVAAAVEATIAARFKIAFTPAEGIWEAILDLQPGPDGKYPAGTEVKIRAFLHLAHSRFVRWEGDASGTAPETTVVVNRDLRIHAVFLDVGTATARPPTATPVPPQRLR